MRTSLFTSGLGLSFLTLLHVSSALGATPTPPEMVETHWPEIRVGVHQIARLPGNRISVKFIYRASDRAPLATYIADRPITGFAPPGGKPREDGLPAGAPRTDVVEYFPYSIEKKGTLIDETTGKIYQPAEEKEGDAVNPGRKDTLQVVGPNEGFYLGGIFDCPPVNQDVPPKIQKITLNLPGLKKPMTDVLLPREENVPHNFYKEPRY